MDLDLKKPIQEILESEEQLLLRLNKKRPKNENFNKFIIEKSKEIRLKCKSNYEIIVELTRLLRELLNFDKFWEKLESKILEVVNDNIKIRLYKIDVDDPEDLERFRYINAVVEDVNFKDEIDKEIFIETIVCYPDLPKPIVLVNDDTEFIKKSRISLSKLRIEADYELDEIEFFELEELLKVLD